MWKENPPSRRLIIHHSSNSVSCWNFSFYGCGGILRSLKAFATNKLSLTVFNVQLQPSIYTLSASVQRALRTPCSRGVSEISLFCIPSYNWHLLQISFNSDDFFMVLHFFTNSNVLSYYWNIFLTRWRLPELKKKTIINLMSLGAQTKSENIMSFPCSSSTYFCK